MGISLLYHHYFIIIPSISYSIFILVKTVNACKLVHGHNMYIQLLHACYKQPLKSTHVYATIMAKVPMKNWKHAQYLIWIGSVSIIYCLSQRVPTPNFWPFCIVPKFTWINAYSCTILVWSDPGSFEKHYGYLRHIAIISTCFPC